MDIQVFMSYDSEHGPGPVGQGPNCCAHPAVLWFGMFNTTLQPLLP